MLKQMRRLKRWLIVAFAIWVFSYLLFLVVVAIAQFFSDKPVSHWGS